MTFEAMQESHCSFQVPTHLSDLRRFCTKI